jgi:hypothetical protein
MWHKRYRHKENCLYLVGDDDELDLIAALEERFDIEIVRDPELAKASSMGLLFDIILRHTKVKCPSVDEGVLWDEMSDFISRFVGYDGPVNRQTTFFYYA